MAKEPTAPDLAAIKSRQRETWASGDFAMIGTPAVIVGELLCEAVDLRAGQKVLDVATGSGNTALAAARRWCEVTGVDYVPALLERGRARAAAERLSIDFRDGDAEALTFPDAAFDAVLSTFGAMFAPNQAKVARELLRVCRPGGKIGMANWTPEGWVGQLFRVIAQHVPPPPGLAAPVSWGDGARLTELFGVGVKSVQVSRRQLVFRHPSPEQWLDYFRKYFGPTLKAFEALDRAGQEALAKDMLELARRGNRSGDTTMMVAAEYLEVVATKRG